MTVSECELVVVGAGGIGSAAFYAAARRGIDVVAVDPFPAAHDHGSSHGQSRMIRGAYFEHPNYVPLVLEAFERWGELEKASGRDLFHGTGVLEVGFPDGPIISGILASAREHGLPLDELTPQQAARRFPQFVVRPDQVALFEQRAGLLRVEHCVQAMIDGAIAAGGRFAPGSAVTAIESLGNRCLVRTTRAQYRCDKVVVTAGAWSAGILDFLLPFLSVRRKHQYWFEAEDRRFGLQQRCPAFYFETATGHFYGFPAMEGNLVKVAQHSGGESVSDPTHVDRALDVDDLRMVQEFAGVHLQLPPKPPRQHSVCMYTMSPDEHFVVDRHPSLPGVAFVAGLSGHGFKFAPVLGELVVDLAEGNRDPRLGFLRLDRLV